MLSENTTAGIDLNLAGLQGEREKAVPFDLGGAIAKFQDELAKAGYGAPEIEPDGVIHRFSLPDDKGGAKTGWFVFHPDGIPSGAFGNWREGSSISWCSKARYEMTAAECAEHDQRVARAKAEQERLKAEAHAKAAQKAVETYASASDKNVNGHPYAVRKGLDFAAMGARRGDQYGRDCLVLPQYDENGNLTSVQHIADGKVFHDNTTDKTYLTGGKKGVLPLGDFRGASCIAIVEGVATGGAVHAATDLPVVVAFDSGNLKAAGELVRRLAAPGAEILFMADDDQKSGEDKNPGITAAEKAAQVVGGRVVLPAMGKKADFWDVWAQGPEGVKQCIEAARVHERRRRFTISTRDEIVSRPFARWTIKGVMLEKGVGAMHGPSTVGKSFVAVDMAAHIAEGLDWFGFRTQKRPVAYFVFEGKAGFSARIQAWERANGRRYPAGVVEVTIPDPGQVDDVSKASFDLRNAQDVQDLCADILDAVGPGAVVILDTLNQAAPGMEENGSVDYGLCLSAAHAIERAIGGFTLFVAHPGKDTSKGLRGHYSLFAGLDLNLELEEVRKDELLFAWIIRKVKDGQDGIKRHFRREVIELGQDADGDPVTSCAIHPDPEADSEGSREKAKTDNLSPSERLALSTFKEAAMEYGGLNRDDTFKGLFFDDWKQFFYVGHTADKEATKKKAFSRARESLVEKGLLQVHDNLYRLAGPDAEIHESIIAEAILARLEPTEGQGT